jgi:hypothetical protein
MRFDEIPETYEGKLLRIAVMRLRYYVYKNKDREQVLKLLEDAAKEFD